MEEGRVRDERTHGFDTVGHEPVETLDEEEKAEHEEEGDVELIAEYGEGEERFGDEHPCLVVQTLEDMVSTLGPKGAVMAYLDLTRLQSPEEDLL